jgi:hypothetical protein
MKRRPLSLREDDMNRSFAISITAALAVASAYACSSGAHDSGFGAGDDAGATGDDGSPMNDSGDNGDVGSLGDSSHADTGGPAKTILYAHDNTNLYSVDATDPNLAATLVGKFDCVGGTGQQSSMTDIAVDKDGKLYGIATKTIYLDMKIVGSSVQCTTNAKAITGGTAAKAVFYGASFAPVGTLDPNNETLVVGNTDGELYEVDITSGAITLINNFGTVPSGQGFMYPGGAWEMSGDIVFLANNGMPIGFATLRDCQAPPSSSSCNPTDTLVQIDLAKFAMGPAGNGVTIRGPIVKSSGCADTTPKYGGMYGIAAFEDKIIGFSHTGFTVSISNNDGTACLIAGTQPKWDGAGVTTTAPVVAPPPR